MDKAQQLPPLPEPEGRVPDFGEVYQASHMQAYATEAIRPYVEALRDLLGWFPGPAAWNTELPTKSAERARALLSSSPASRQTEGATPEPAKKFWYMRDNHTFRPLTGTPEEMVAQCLEEFDAGYTCGMLCSDPTGLNIHAHGKARRDEFEAAALSALHGGKA